MGACLALRWELASGRRGGKRARQWEACAAAARKACEARPEACAEGSLACGCARGRQARSRYVRRRARAEGSLACGCARGRQARSRYVRRRARATQAPAAYEAGAYACMLAN